MSTFKKVGEVSLINGGYLSGTDKKPVTHKGFVAAQLEAEFLVALAAAMSGKSFSCQEGEDINALAASVRSGLSGTAEEFIKMPKAPKTTLGDKLAKEALEFVGFHQDTEEAKRINAKLQAFSIISEFEAFGLFFKPGMVKLNRIYTVAEITDAAKIVYAVLD